MRTPPDLRALAIGIATLVPFALPVATSAATPSASTGYAYNTVLDDALVSVITHTLLPGQSEPARHDGCRVVYSLSNQSVMLTSAGGTTQDLAHKFRSAWWRPAEDMAYTNKGLQPIKELIVMFKTGLPGVRGCEGPPLPRTDLAADSLDAMRAAAPFYKVVYENPAIRVLEANVPAGTITPLHQLRCRLSYALTDQTVRVAHDSASVEDLHRAVSLPWWDPAETLAVENRGVKNAFSLVVEFKHKGVGDASCPPAATGAQPAAGH